ncbi:phosphate acyltransferase [Enterococcus sp. LJL51]|uniref:phosphate acyltransferase n=1 Tax=Enterococcus sp. LJL51 TaxID=3416656 RepID=UPI003CEFBEEB
MTNVAVPGGSQPEILELVKAAKRKYGSAVNFYIFDEAENIDQDNLWTYISCEKGTMIQKAVQSLTDGQTQILLKGIVQTHDMLKEVLKKEHALKSQSLLSHVSIIDIPKLGRPLLLTDAGMNIAPTKDQQIQIIENAVSVAEKMGLAKPKVALLSSAETYNPKMPSSILAQEVTEYFRNQEEFIVYGPLSLDLALSKEAVAHKKFTGPIEGDADILVVPSIDVGNVFYKSLLLFGNASTGGLIAGVKIPIVLTSRSDSVENKLYSLEFALEQLKE